MRCYLSKIFLLYRILLKMFLQIQCTINMGIEQITSIKWLTMKLYWKLMDLIIFVHIAFTCIIYVHICICTCIYMKLKLFEIYFEIPHTQIPASLDNQPVQSRYKSNEWFPQNARKAKSKLWWIICKWKKDILIHHKHFTCFS